MLILGYDDVRQALEGRELDVLAAVRTAYLRHERGSTAVPHSVFLRFPEDERNRIIALPAYLGGEQPVAGVKWISSFPGNLQLGLERASAAIILNSMRTGRPEALLEGSVISARRTAAGAALAAATLRAQIPDTGVSLIGCGVINRQVLRFLRAALPQLETVTLFDLDGDRAAAFARRCAEEEPELKTGIADRVEEALGAHPLVCLATTAAVPHLGTEHCRPGGLVLHLSLRDLLPQAVLGAVNVVDDADHVCRAATSLHLAEQQVGHREFIAGTLGGILAQDRPYQRDGRRVTVFSPFGLGILDLAVADLVRRAAEAGGHGTSVAGFLAGGAG
ncbi:2,3-diaminopropionate biosynthesis protein SbnB [Kitasatospora sp. NPDC052896]|uniref:2,3-diaminopropionate biosynthesis protein SbnB n=1 Tax=Kitasatospora sp. NPDC052896 TaxID=3364061 RepID=UPI0037C687BB